MGALAVSSFVSNPKEGNAQTLKQDNLKSNKVEVTDNKSNLAAKELESLLGSVAVGDNLSKYEHKIDSLIAQKVIFTQDQLQDIFSAFTETFNKESSTITKKLEVINKKLFNYVYANENSPFAEQNGKLSFDFKKDIDSSIPDLEGKKLFNLVFNKKFTFDSVETLFDDDNKTLSRIILHKADDNLKVRLNLDVDGYVHHFDVFAKKDGKDFLYVYSASGGGNNNAFNAEDYQNLKNAFLQYFK